MADKEACSRIEQRSVIKFLVAEECKAVEIHRRMSIVYGTTCFSRKNVYKCAKLFKAERRNVEDEDRPERPTELKSPEVVKSVNDFIQFSRRMKVDELQGLRAYLLGQHTKLFMMTLAELGTANLHSIPQPQNCKRCFITANPQVYDKFAVTFCTSATANAHHCSSANLD